MSDLKNVEQSVTKDVFLRNVTITLLDVLNRKIQIDQVVDGVIQTSTVPVFYQFGNDENFMKDFFIELPHGCKIPSHAEGNFEQYPKGTIRLTSFSVKSQEITNKFVRGTVKNAETDANGQKVLSAYSAYLFSLPLKIEYEAKLHGSTMNQAMHMSMSLFEELYKQRVAYYQFRGVRLPVQYQFPDETQIEKVFEFDYSNDNRVTVSFTIECETFYPIFDRETMQFKGHRILKFINAAPGTLNLDVDAAGQ